MSTRSVTIEISAEMYEALNRRAVHSSRSVADELVRAAQRDVANDQLPAELENELAALPHADDGALQRVALSRLSDHERQRLEELHDLKGARGLSSDEEDEASGLLAGYDRCLVLRAHALALLKERGHDLTQLLRT